MPSTSSNLKDNTTLVNNNTTTGLLQTIQVLKQDLNHTRDEKNQIANQLSCLISLVKRSWMGDNVALFHVANIIGMPVPAEAQEIEDQNNPQTRAKMNWERLSLRLLDREYQAVQEEIKERQQHYINYREVYMDEILNSHQEQMAQLTLHKNSTNSLQNVDKQFMKSFKPNSRPPTGKIRKCPSAAKRPGKIAEDIVDKVDIGLGNLLFTGNPESVSRQQNTADYHKRGSISECIQNEEKSNGQYDDSQRYSKTNLFDTKDAFGSKAFQKKKRPCSASELREKDKLRSRPKSAITGLKSGKSERSIKYEVTRPVSGKPSAKTTPDRRGSLQDTRQNRNSIADESLLIQQEKAKSELKSRIKSATQRPRDIDTFAEEVKTINDMENRFKQNAVDLQKKLGINRGMIY
ncbi:hypothetical protein LOTGIDRAFT_231384 [Lottia gigantea]|uniref:Uncharacterized protein n=1 Tax=Lottia gigantea TaxID=225164 RepID=V4C966_LOTGI|nr:hypothetical protein LOTGIDRAFT_231384 [Lottia gigantea]ESO98304.1 hypothetical protein LOTGIDRAFT_231384 [Lottia gigantea]